MAGDTVLKETPPGLEQRKTAALVSGEDEGAAAGCIAHSNSIVTWPTKIFLGEPR